jgi:anti-sigma factor RsiW
MKCEQVTERLNMFLDGELTGAAAQAVEEHVAGCARCADALEQLKRLNRALDVLDGMPVQIGFADRVRAQAVVGPRPGAFGRLNGTLTRIAAFVLVVIGLWSGVMMGRSLSAADSSTAQAESDDLDVQVHALSAAPVGSVTGAYLDMVAEAE